MVKEDPLEIYDKLGFNDYIFIAEENSNNPG